MLQFKKKLFLTYTYILKCLYDNEWDKQTADTTGVKSVHTCLRQEKKVPVISSYYI